MSEPSIAANAFVDRVEVLVPTSAWVLTPQEFRTIRETPTGERSERLAFQPPGYPAIKRKARIDLQWGSVGDSREHVERIAAVPGEHTLILWRHEQLAFLCDGARDVFHLPMRWTLAVDQVAPPGGLPASKFGPRVMVGVAGAVLTYASVDDATFDGAAGPPAGTVWFRRLGADFRLEAPAAAGAVVYARVVPEYTVFHTPPPAKTLDKPNREPAVLTFLEV